MSGSLGVWVSDIKTSGHQDIKTKIMDQVILEAVLRTKLGKGDAHQLRAKGEIPAVFYGKGAKNLHLAIKRRDLEKAVSSKMGMNTIIQLKVPGKGDFNVLLKTYQADAIKRDFTHADFITVDLTQKIEIAVPVLLTGKAVGVKEGGILEQVTREVTIFCLPTAIPKQIEVDVTPLKIGQNLHLSDIKLPAGVESHEKSDVTLASVVAPKEEELTPGTLTEPEVLTAKKPEEGEGAEAGKAPAPKGPPSGAKGGEEKASEAKKPAEKEKK